MADIGDISELLRLLTGSGNEADGESSGGGTDDGIFGDIDPEMLIRILGMISKLTEEDESTALITALRPLLRPENREKLDRAAKIMKLIGILPLLRDSGIGLF